MKTLSINATTQPIKVEQKRKTYSFSIGYLLSSICLLACLTYGLGQVEAVTAFYENVMAELSTLKVLLEYPAAFLK